MAESDETGRAHRIRVRLVHKGQEEEEADREFWNELAPVARLELLWDMVRELRAWRGEAGDEPRLQRSVLHVRRA